MRLFSRLPAVLCLFVLVPVCVDAQWSAGIRVGISLPQEVMVIPTTTRAAPSAVFGGSVRYQLTSWLAAEAHPQYSLRGRSLLQPFFAPDADEWTTPRFGYLEIPIGLSIGTRILGIDARLFGGVSPALLLSRTVTYEHWDNGEGIYLVTEEHDLSARTKSFDIGLDIGLGLSAEIIEGVHLGIDVRGTEGKIEIINELPGDRRTSTTDAPYFYRTVAYMISGGLMFEL
jgi:hypothetical protein